MKTDPILEKILQKPGNQWLFEQLSQNLSGSELTSLLLGVFQEKTHRLNPSQVLREFDRNRLIQPGNVDPVQLMERELQWLRLAKEKGFEPVLLSPVAPLGSCSVFGKVNQNKVISALRNTEVLADATNMLALKIASEVKKGSKTSLRFSATHRHIRAQQFSNPNFSPHFQIFCMASGALDRGSYSFEKTELENQLGLILSLLTEKFPKNKLSLKFYLKEKNSPWQDRLDSWFGVRWGIPVSFEEDSANHYYDCFQFKVFLELGENVLDLADGGMVNWTQQLTGNKKHRCMISGIGLELVEKLSLGAGS